MRSTSGRERAIAFALIAAAFVIAFGPALRAQFYVVEDHLLIDGKNWGLLHLWDRTLSDLQNFQRVRPAYWLYVGVTGAFFGANPHLWHAAVLFIGTVTTWLNFITLRRLCASRLAASIFAALLVVGGGYNWIWVNLITQETIGLLVAAIAIWAIVAAAARTDSRLLDVIALASLTTAGLIKESFILIIPALALLRVVARMQVTAGTWREGWAHARWLSIAALAVFILELSIVASVVLAHPTGYSATASGALVGRQLGLRVARLFGTFEVAAGLLPALLIWIWMLIRSTHRRALLIGAALVCALWVIPQLVLYAGSFEERYQLPAVVGVLGAFALTLSHLLEGRRSRWLGYTLALAAGGVASIGLQRTTMTVSAFAAETVAVHRAVQYLADNIDGAQAVLVAADTGTPYGFEAIYSLPLFIHGEGLASPVYLFPIVSRGERSPRHIAASEGNTRFRYPDTLEPSRVGAIVMADRWIASFDPRALTEWMGNSAWREIRFTEAFHGWTFQPFGYRPLGQVTQRVLIHAANASVPQVAALITVDRDLSGAVDVLPILDPPPWGLEPDYAGPGSIVWLGRAENEGVGAVLTASARTVVDLVCDLEFGPDLVLERELTNRAGTTTVRYPLSRSPLIMEVTLEPGSNQVRLHARNSGPASASGGTRVMLLRRLRVRATPEPR